MEIGFELSLDTLILIKNIGITFGILVYFMLIGIGLVYKNLLKKGRIQGLAVFSFAVGSEVIVNSLLFIPLLFMKNSVQDCTVSLLYTIFIIFSGLIFIGSLIVGIIHSFKKTKKIIIEKDIVDFFKDFKIRNYVNYNDIHLTLPEINVKAKSNGKYEFQIKDAYKMPSKPCELSQEELICYCNELKECLYKFEKRNH